MAKNPENTLFSGNHGLPLKNTAFLEDVVRGKGIHVINIAGSDQIITISLQDMALSQDEMNRYGITLDKDGKYVLPRKQYLPPSNSHID